MLNKQTILISASVLLLAAGCTTNPEKGCVSNPDKQVKASESSIKKIEAEISNMINQADAARKKAASVKGEWRDTGKFIKNAKAALTDGKYEKAIKLAKKAKKEGDLGYQQMMNQKDLKMPGYFKF